MQELRAGSARESHMSCILHPLVKATKYHLNFYASPLGISPNTFLFFFLKYGSTQSPPLHLDIRYNLPLTTRHTLSWVAILFSFRPCFFFSVFSCSCSVHYVRPLWFFYLFSFFTVSFSFLCLFSFFHSFAEHFFSFSIFFCWFFFFLLVFSQYLLIIFVFTFFPPRPFTVEEGIELMTITFYILDTRISPPNQTIVVFVSLVHKSSYLNISRWFNMSNLCLYLYLYLYLY
jgi:hypothetical protein